MRLDIVNHSSHKDAPVAQMYGLLGVWMYHFTNHVPGSLAVLHAFQQQGAYVELVNDLPEAPGAVAYHSVDDNGVTVMRVGVDICLNNGSTFLTGPISVISAAEHEVGEGLGNPLCDGWVDQPDGRSETAKERCDGCQDIQYRHAGADHSDFLLDSWFNPWGKPPYTFTGTTKISRPFQLSPGGYKVVRSTGAERQVMGQRGEVVGELTTAGARAEYGEAYPEWRKGTNGRARALGVTAP